MSDLKPFQPRIIGFETEYGIHDVVSIPPIAPDYKKLYDIYAALPAGLTTADDGFGMTEIGRIYGDSTIDNYRLPVNIEFASPELLSLRGLLGTYFTAESIVDGIKDRLFNTDTDIDSAPHYAVLKRSLDNDRRTRGDHENYSISSELLYENVLSLEAHLATRTILTGCGAVIPGSKVTGQYLVDQRTAFSSSSFIRTPQAHFGLDTNTGPRLEVLSGSHNMYPYPVAARFFNTSSVLRLIEAGDYPDHLNLVSPVRTATQTAHYANTALVWMEDGKVWHPAEVQYELMTRVLRLELPPEERAMAELSAAIAADISAGKTDAWSDHLEYAAKQQFINEQTERKDVAPLGYAAAALDIRWHIPGKQGIIDDVRVVRPIAMMPDQDTIDDARSFPIDPTRAQDRSLALIEASKTGDILRISQWDRWQKQDDPYIVIQTDPYGTRPQQEELNSQEVGPHRFNWFGISG